jgi:hypothetical protein
MRRKKIMAVVIRMRTSFLAGFSIRSHKALVGEGLQTIALQLKLV